MADYIKRSVLIQKAEHEAESMSEPYKSTFPSLVDWLSAKIVPIDDVAPLKHGEWVNGECSECGGDAPFWSMATTYYRSNFCPNCGADMRGGT